MENNFKQYEMLLDSAAKAAETCLDMEGGMFLLTWSGLGGRGSFQERPFDNPKDV